MRIIIVVFASYIVASGDPSSSNNINNNNNNNNETHLNKKYHDERDDNKTQCSIFDKYLDGLDSNGFVADIVPATTPEVVVPATSADKSDSVLDFNDAYLEAEFKKMAEQFNDLNSLFDYEYGQPVENNSLSGVGGGSGPSVNADDMEMDTSYFKESLLTAAKNVQKTKAAMINDATVKTNNSPNPEAGGGGGGNGVAAPKTCISEDIDCIVESCCILKRSNALKCDFQPMSEDELVEITEILPTNSNCNQLLVKLVKTKVPRSSRNKMIITDVMSAESVGEEREDDDDYAMNEEEPTIGGQLLLFDCLNGIIPNEHKIAMTFSRQNYPKQICMLPNFQTISIGSEPSSVATNSGAFCVVCADGTIEIISLADFQSISSIKEEEHHFTSVAYCRSLERLCCCTRRGSLIFYSLNDADNESGDEMIDIEEEVGPAAMLGSSIKNDGGVGNGCCVTDGATPQKSNDQQQQGGGEGATGIMTEDLHKTTSATSSSGFTTSIKVDCGTGLSGAISQPSPSPSSTSMNTAATSNLLAYRSGELSLDDLRTLYSLTQFDDKVVPYTAEVPSCWNDLVQAQKQRKQSQHTWRLHNDA